MDAAVLLLLSTQAAGDTWLLWTTEPNDAYPLLMPAILSFVSVAELAFALAMACCARRGVVDLQSRDLWTGFALVAFALDVLLGVPLAFDWPARLWWVLVATFAVHVVLTVYSGARWYRLRDRVLPAPVAMTRTEASSFHSTASDSVLSSTAP